MVCDSLVGSRNVGGIRHALLPVMTMKGGGGEGSKVGKSGGLRGERGEGSERGGEEESN
jgi:hypothetical protein